MEAAGQKFLHSVQCHICQDWRYDAALWGAFIRGEQFVLEDESSLEELLEHRFIHRDMLCQPVVADMVKAPFNVALQNPLWRAFLAQRSKDIFTGILRTTSLTEAKGFRVCRRFRHRVECQCIKCLHGSVIHTRYAKRPFGLFALFLNIYPAQRFRFVTSICQGQHAAHFFCWGIP